MLRTVVAALLAVPALALSSSAYAASPTTLLATVGPHKADSTKISLEEGSHLRGELVITRCANTSSTTFVCKGTGTVFDLTGKVRVRWQCPVHKPCAKKGEGTLKSHGSLLGLLHVAAGVPTFQKQAAQFGIVWEPTGE
jgi:hypothetical protein